MPVDPDALLKTIADILSNIPSGIVVALLLGGPTAIWLVLRLVNPREARSRFGSGWADLHWICTECRSLNENRNDRCYRCLMARTDAVLPLLAIPPAADATDVGIPVGPGLAVGPPRADWLAPEVDDELDVVNEADEVPEPATEELAEPADEATEPATADLVPAMAAVPEAPPIFEPLALEPRVKPARKARSPRSSRRG